MFKSYLMQKVPANIDTSGNIAAEDFTMPAKRVKNPAAAECDK